MNSKYIPLTHIPTGMFLPPTSCTYTAFNTHMHTPVITESFIHCFISKPCRPHGRLSGRGWESGPCSPGAYHPPEEENSEQTCALMVILQSGYAAGKVCSSRGHKQGTSTQAWRRQGQSNDLTSLGKRHIPLFTAMETSYYSFTSHTLSTYETRRWQEEGGGH